MPIATKSLQFYLRGAEYERMREVVEDVTVVADSIADGNEKPRLTTTKSTRHIGRPHHHYHRHYHYHRDGTVRTSTKSTAHNLERRYDGGGEGATQAEAIRRRKRKWKRIAILARNGCGLFGRPQGRRSSLVATAEALSAGGAAAALPVPSWVGGSIDKFTIAALKLRDSLRQHAGLEEELQRWWDTSMRSASDEERAAGTLARRSYVDLANLITKSSVKVFSLADSTTSAELDWEADVPAGMEALPRDAFATSLFELADIWIRGTVRAAL